MTRNKADQYLAAFTAYLTAMNCTDLLPGTVSEYDEDQYTINFYDGEIGVDLEWPMQMNSPIRGPFTAHGFRVWHMEHSPGTREIPPDAWDATDLETLSIDAALSALDNLAAASKREDAKEAFFALIRDDS